ncbi:transposase family protein [Streptomyces sp. NPDC001450]
MIRSHVITPQHAALRSTSYPTAEPIHRNDGPGRARACPSCGVFATRVKGTAVTRPRDLPYGERDLQFRWHERRWWCREPLWPRKSFTEQLPQIPARARLTTRLRQAAG